MHYKTKAVRAETGMIGYSSEMSTHTHWQGIMVVYTHGLSALPRELLATRLQSLIIY
jgi:hypothetical protein